MICMTPTANPLSLASGETEHFAGNAKASPTRGGGNAKH